MSDTQGPDQFRTKLSTASTILGLALFAALCISLCIRQYSVVASRRHWPWSTRRRDPRTSVEIRFSEDEPRTIAIGGRAKTLRIPPMWDAYIQMDRPLKHKKTDAKTAKSLQGPLEGELARMQPVSIQMLTPHTAGSLSASSILLSPASVTPPPLPQETPQPPPRAVRVALYPHGPLPTPRIQSRTLPRDSTPATSHSHTGVPILVFSPSTPGRSNPQEFPVPIYSGPSPTPLSTSILAPHPLQLTFLITLPDPFFPCHFPPPRYPQIASPPTAPSLSPTLGTLTPPPTFLLPSLNVPAESLSSWWDLPEELLRAEGNRAPGWEFRLREMHEVRSRVSGGDDVALALRWNGRPAGRRG